MDVWAGWGCRVRVCRFCAYWETEGAGGEFAQRDCEGESIIYSMKQGCG
jgi:hypothetical protein